MDTYTTVPQPYNHGLSLLTDLYALSMAYAHWKAATADYQAVFYLSFRRAPFQGSFTVACGLANLIDYVQGFGFSQADLMFLSKLQGNDGRPLFERTFLDYLAALRLNCSISAVPEGTLVFPHEPLVRVVGSIIECQLLESAFLNIINFQSLIATKAARLRLAAGSDPLLEFGLRRAQGVDGALSASRAAYIGGCDATSNVLASRLFGIPARGTHAHSWVMALDEEEEAFMTFASALPNNTILLVDTYDTLEGVHKAAKVGKWLRQQGYCLAGIRLDSGDLVTLSQAARRILDEAGLSDTKIYASNDLDELQIAELKLRGARISAWGVGTRLVTGNPEAALGGVYKLSAVRKPGSREWQHRLKLSEDPEKSSLPGMLQVRRFLGGGYYARDVIYDEQLGLTPETSIVDLNNPDSRTIYPNTDDFHDLLVAVFESGRLVYNPVSPQQARQKTKSELARLPSRLKQLQNAGSYSIGLEERLQNVRYKLLSQHRHTNSARRKLAA